MDKHEWRSPSKTGGRERRMQMSTCIFSEWYISTQYRGYSRQQASAPPWTLHMTTSFRVLVLAVLVIPRSACFGLARGLNSALAVFCFIAGQTRIGHCRH